METVLNVKPYPEKIEVKWWDGTIPDSERPKNIDQQIGEMLERVSELEKRLDEAEKRIHIALNIGLYGTDK